MLDVISRTEATEQGLVNYFTGKPCSRGHIAERNVKGKQCVECRTLAITAMRERVGEDAWVQKERARGLDYNRRNHAKRLEASKKFMARLYEQDPQRFVRRSREREAWLKAEHPEVFKLSAAARRAAYRAKQLGMENPTDSITAAVIRVWHRQGGVCAACPSTDRLELDHRVALMNGGTNIEENFQFLCKPCNSSKGARDWQTWLATRAQPTEIAA